MKKIILTTTFALGTIIGINAQSLPSLPTNTDDLKKDMTEVKTEAKTEIKTVETQITTTAGGTNVSKVSKVLSFIKTKVNITPQQETKILSVASKLDLSKSTSPKDQLKTLLSSVDFTKIFSSAQLTKLKSLVSK